MIRYCQHCGKNLTTLRGKHGCLTLKPMPPASLDSEKQNKILKSIKESQKITEELQEERELKCTCCPVHGARY